MSDIIPPNFAPPALPYPPSSYDRIYIEQFNKVLRLYFNQLDSYLRNLNLASLNVTYSGATVDAFGRLRVSTLYTF